MTRRFVLRGDAAALRVALDRVHVGCDVLGVLEGDDETEVRVAGALPELDGVVVEELAEDPRAWTGLEVDRAFLVTDDLLVRPPWVERPAGFAGVELVVPRGMAFGSGEHGSTQAALCVLAEVWPSGAVASCADIGTGSGILALYAMERGAERILACDVEPESVVAASELLPGADVRLGGPEVFGEDGADLVVANLDARQLGAALDAILRLWSGRAPLLLSGMRPAEVAVIAARVPADELLRVERQGFVAVAFAGR